MSKKNKVLVIGAGISGLAAAKNLNDTGYDVTILEAKDRIGGRLYTDRSLGVPLEVGANWIHDNNPKTNPIMKIKEELGLKAHKCSVAGPNVSFEVLDKELTSSFNFSYVVTLYPLIGASNIIFLYCRISSRVTLLFNDSSLANAFALFISLYIFVIGALAFLPMLLKNSALVFRPDVLMI